MDENKYDFYKNYQKESQTVFYFLSFTCLMVKNMMFI